MHTEHTAPVHCICHVLNADDTYWENYYYYYYYYYHYDFLFLLKLYMFFPSFHCIKVWAGLSFCLASSSFRSFKVHSPDVRKKAAFSRASFCRQTMIKIRVKERHPQLPKVVILCFVKKWQISNSNPRKW